MKWLTSDIGGHHQRMFCSDGSIQPYWVTHTKPDGHTEYSILPAVMASFDWEYIMVREPVAIYVPRDIDRRDYSKLTFSILQLRIRMAACCAKAA